MAKKLLVFTLDTVVESHEFKAGDVAGEMVKGKIKATAKHLDFGLIQARVINGVIAKGTPEEYKAPPPRKKDDDDQGKAAGDTNDEKPAKK